jgi:hypothetical protein
MQVGAALYGTTREVAERFAISESTLEKLRLSGGGPVYIKRGRSVRYAFKDVEEWLAAGRRRSTSAKVASSTMLQKSVRRVAGAPSPEPAAVASQAFDRAEVTANPRNPQREEAAQRQEARVREWIARWRPTRRSHAAVARHPFGCEVAQ